MSKLIRIVLDWECAFGRHPVTEENITLKTITTENYVRHKNFKAHGLGVKIDKDPAFYLYKRDDLLYFLKNHPWDRTLAIAHHSHFDGAILGWRCGIQPAFWGDTLSMARAIFPHEPNSLERTAEILGVGTKGKELMTVKDLWTLTDEQQEVLGGYCATNEDSDVNLTSRAFDALVKHFPLKELKLIDLNTRLFTEPVLQVEPMVLIKDFVREKRAKRALMKRCGVSKTALASNDQFAAILMAEGVEPPKKVSPSKVKDKRVDPKKVGEPPTGLLPPGKMPKGLTKEEKEDFKAKKKVYPWTYAFSKDDEEFNLLLEHPDQHVIDLVEARKGIKSTIKETRAKRFWKIGSRGAFPVYHNYYGAKTGRDCLVEDTEIYILRFGQVLCILLPELLPDDLVWDSVEFVAHGGVICKGEMEVITHDGITGTKDHRVFCEENEEETTLREAKERGYKIKTVGPPQQEKIAALIIDPVGGCER